jgi:hypothetical protein
MEPKTIHAPCGVSFTDDFSQTPNGSAHLNQHPLLKYHPHLHLRKHLIKLQTPLLKKLPNRNIAPCVAVKFEEKIISATTADLQLIRVD